MKSRLKIKKGIEMAPMVDILFLLVTYFLLNSTIGKNAMIRVDLPESVTSSVIRENNMTISINNSNEIFLENEKVTMKSLKQKLVEKKKHAKKDLKVLIRGDKKTDYQIIIRVMDTIHSSGITRFSLAADREVFQNP